MRRQKIHNVWCPRDGWVMLQPQKWITYHIDTQTKPTEEEVFRFSRQLRGNILASSFDIDHQLTSIALIDIFGNSEPEKNPEYFKKEKIWRDKNLSDKIKRIEKIVKSRFSFSEAFLNDLISNLSDLKDLRNLMAHYPSWIEPINDCERDRTIGFKLLIANSDFIWDVDESQVKTWYDLISLVNRVLEDIFKDLVEVLSQK